MKSATTLNDKIKQNEQFNDELRLADERTAMLAAIVESSNDAIISKNLHGIVTSWNLAAESIFGYSAAEMINEPVIKLIPEDRLNEELVILSRMRAGERIDHFETKRRTKNGILVDVSLTISPIRSSNGEIIGVSKIARDITDMKRAEQKSSMLAAIIESTDDAIFSKDLDDTITSWNNSAERIFGYTAQEMIGQSILKLIPPDRQGEEILILNQLKNGQRLENYETKRLTKDGKLVDVSMCISPIMNSAGDLVGLSRIARDITDRKLEEQRKNDFISIVSHELKTPLTTIKSYVQLALNKAKQSDDNFIENILTRADLQTDKMIKMIHDFLNLSRLEEGKMTLNLSRFSLPELMDEIVSEIRVIGPNHLVEYHGCADIKIMADKDKIGQVMSNLLGNAVKYSQPGTTITIDCEEANGQVEISVTDQGIGITPHDQKRLFDRFYRVNDEDVSKKMGFGIGLYLVSEILRLHDSVIHVKSELGKGSVFSFVLHL